jgi:hypothetical protein
MSGSWGKQVGLVDTVGEWHVRCSKEGSSAVSLPGVKTGSARHHLVKADLFILVVLGIDFMCSTPGATPPVLLCF